MEISMPGDEKIQDLLRTAGKIRRHIVHMVYTAQSGHPGGACPWRIS
jgi:transketolase N-terminal domain/subunit